MHSPFPPILLFTPAVDLKTPWMLLGGLAASVDNVWVKDIQSEHPAGLLCCYRRETCFFLIHTCLSSTWLPRFMTVDGITPARVQC